MIAGARRLLLVGSADALSRALDILHVQTSVLGVEERDGECEVWLAGDWQAALVAVADVRVRELPITADLFGCTGLEHDAPLLITEDLCVRPPWVAQPAGFSGIDLVVPRGGVFGSGEHASTRAALLALHRFWPGDVDAVIDVGTGSGILALYGAARGARTILACDIDASAARAAADLVPGLRAVCGGPRALALAADVVVANMTATELAVEIEAIAELWRGRGLLVLSGLRGRAQVDACRHACAIASIRREPAALTVEDFTALAFAA